MSRRVKKATFLVAALSTLLLPEVAMCADVMIKQAIGAALRYDTNAYIRPENQSQISDLILFITPSVEVSTETGRVSLAAFYSPSGSVYFNNTELNNVSHHLNLHMSANLSEKSTLDVNDIFTYSKDPISTTLLGIQMRRETIWSNELSLGLTHAFTQRTSGSIGLSTHYLESDDPATTKSKTDSISLSGRFQATPATSLSASYSSTFFSFKSNEGRNNIVVHSAQLGLTHSFPYKLDFNISGGTSYAPEINNHREWIASTWIEKAFQNSSLHIEYSRRITNTSGLTDQLNINERYSAVMSYSTTKTTSLILNGSYVKNRTLPDSLLVNITSYDVGITEQWRPYPWMSVGLGYSHFQQISTAEIGEDFKSDHFFINLTATTYERKI